MKVFLIGFMGCGKTTIGRHLALSAGIDFVDTDRSIEMQEGMTVSEIFERQGEAAFRRMEQKILSDLHNCSSAVVATGGGMPCHEDNINRMLASGKVAYLKASPQTLVKRLIQSQTERPLIKGKTETQLLQYITEKLSEREPFYKRANITLQTENKSIKDIVSSFQFSVFRNNIDTLK